jgi:hypothetical protein
MIKALTQKSTLIILSVFILTIGVLLIVLWYVPSRQEGPSVTTSFAHITLPSNPAPEHVVLTVNGKIRKANPALFDLTTIQAFQPITFTIFDPWDKQEQTYEGTPVIDILQFLEMENSAETIEVVARNGYEITINVDDLKQYTYIFSYAMNGKLYNEYTGSQNKGPLAIAIDFSRNAEIDIEIYKHQLVWFVETVTVR